jgi:hypothetical protein
METHKANVFVTCEINLVVVNKVKQQALVDVGQPFNKFETCFLLRSLWMCYLGGDLPQLLVANGPRSKFGR